MPVNIVRLPDPLPTQVVARRASVAPRSLTGDLPGDIVLEILKNLEDKDAVHLASVSKAFYAAFPPRPTNVTYKSLVKAISLQERLAQTPGAALRLVSLDVRCPGPASKISPILCDILSEARNLRSLTCGPAELKSDNVRNIIQRLAHLAHLQLYVPPISALTTTSYPSSLSSLYLVGFKGGITWKELATSLSRLTGLKKLSLLNSLLDESDPDDDLDENDTDDEDEDGGATPALPTVTSLAVSSSDLPSLAFFAKTFPNVNDLVLEETHFPEDDEADTDVADRVIHKVSFLVSEDVEYALPWQAEHVRLFTFDIGQINLESGLCGMDGLIGLALRVLSFSWDSWTEQISSSIPQTVRLLELESFDTDFPMTLGFFANVFEEHSPEAVGELPALTVLSIAAPSSPGPLDELRARFFEHAALALPKLRYVALASPRQIPQDFSDLAGDRAPWRWWRIIRSAGQDVEFREIPAWEGERVRRYFRDANREKAERFDEDFSALR
ncbi:hypothetical protein TRAPUB_13186 [Trametes pubescens]|uniref:F-box domain-containing protein n=1 Tax=Trametes pubescens TaxID=154538 RepID=A0A1M2VRX5_TRAPU|nr:hypothetical protein TRAPUB_13186 [Trametes pubescens]